jgi:cell division protein FtsI/penicillin-binding protein 2/cell division protein FtsW (lipid II flippase)
MATTKTWEANVASQLHLSEKFRGVERRREAIWLLGASLLVIGGLALVFLAKTQDFTDLDGRLRNGELVNLNRVAAPEQLAPALLLFTENGERKLAAERIWNYLEPRRPLANVGTLARIRVPKDDLADFPDLQRRRPAASTSASSTVPLLPVSKLKPLLVVRSPQEFRQTFLVWCLIYVGAFWMVHVAWRWRKFRGDPAILPALQLLTGIGLILMVSLRDPLRDTLEFKKFAWGSAIGCMVLVLPLLRAFQVRNFSRWIYTPLMLAFALFAALIAFGSGPTGSDAKVNLGPFQPVEVIKLLVVFFLTGYFTKRWEWLREVHQKRLVPQWLRFLEIPRFSHTLSVMSAVGCALAFFFLLKDMGPALVMGFVFLCMFEVARGKSGLAIFGVVLLVAGVSIGYRIGAPRTVVERVSMWLSPWDNDLRGGDQLAHSLWAFATGGLWGSGPGWGDPAVIPAGHTDLVLPAIGEEWGFIGVVIVCLLLGFLVHRAFRIALESHDDYSMFLGVGLGSLLALEMLLISGGALGAIPLSGVVSPFLSSGNTAMLANFLVCAVLLCISNQTARSAPALDIQQPVRSPFRIPVRVIAIALGACAVALLAKAAYIQVLHDREFTIQDARVITQDGMKREQYNPRLNLFAASIPRGDIYDRNGVLLATSSWAQLEKHRGEYERLGISLDQACSRLESRHFPFGTATAHLLGDFRTGENFLATNSSLIEHDSRTRLQGYTDYRELAPLVRYRHQRSNPALQAFLSRDRDVHATIDVRLQLKATDILRKRLEPSAKKGALVVLDASTGDVLALVSWPGIPQSGQATPDQLLDRARYGQYPPGSTFKLVTAMAALRLDPRATQKTFSCRGLGGGRVGTIIPGWRRPIRDDVGDHAHGTLDLGQAIAVSCNAYFAQLGVYAVGPQALYDTAQLLGISAGDVADIKKMMPFASYGQGTVVASPFKMARVSATIAAGGLMPEGRWVSDPSNTRTSQPVPILNAESSTFLARAMRSVVTGGTARRAMAGLTVSVAGKTGTAQVDDGDPHSWFAGFAPYDGNSAQRIAFAVVVEHGGYGAKFAAPIGREIVEAAAQLGLVLNPTPEKR